MKLTALLAAALSAGLCAATASAQIKGKVTLDGEAPEPQEINMAADAKCKDLHKGEQVFDESVLVGDNNELANVVVSIKPMEDKPFKKAEVPKKPVEIDQQGCKYVPHVVGMMVGQELIVKNSDPLPHNVHSMAIDNNPFNLAQPKAGISHKVGKNVTMAERFVIKCDIHPWMTVHVNAFEHPYFAVSNEKGEFEIPTKDLPNGTYELEIWHERLAPVPIIQEVEVKGGKAEVEEIKLAADAANAQADDAASDVKLAAAESKDCEKGACCESQSKAQAIAAAAAGK